ncbi:MAG: epoxyqueuosine reductase QueH [Candidatus Moranbacteria bacterium]|nr:epoxyqueuosine reductase QueH [Candidatus Moranbacteria bacterium]
MTERLLLHTCCAPCGIAVIDELRKSYDLSVLFYNPNIFPEEEYLKRKREVIRVCGEWDIPMIDADYEPDAWGEAIRGLEGEPEGGRRCPVCFRSRLFRSAEIAAERGFPVFATTLTSGRNKRDDIISPIGDAAAAKVGVRFLAEDWKKGGRQEAARKMVCERGIYRQDYCGCRYSLAERGS